MSDFSGPILDEDLHAYVDGQLGAARRAEVEAHLAADSEAAAKVAAWRAQNAALHSAYDGVLREPVPPQLMPGAPPLPVRLARHAAAAALYLAIGGGLGWSLAPRPEVPPSPAPPVAAAGFPERAAVAHAVYAPEVRHPVEVGADDRAHLVSWLSKRLDIKLTVPNLAGMGFDLVGGRLLPDAKAPAAQLMYQDANGRRVTLYVKTGEAQNRETAFRWVREGSVEVCFWIDGPVGYALASEMDRKDVYRLAKLVYQQVN